MEQDVFLGPLFTLGAVLLGLGLRRRSWFLGAAGIAAIAVDQKLPAGQRLNRRLSKALSDV
jgi:hypothetical protein